MKKIKKILKNYFLTGLIVIIPGYISVVILITLIKKMDGIINLLPPKFHPDTYLPFHIPGLGVIITILLIIFVGLIFTNIIGKSILNFLENKIVTKIPFIRTIYKGAKNIIETILSDETVSFKEVVLVEYPKKGTYALGFITSKPSKNNEIVNKIGHDKNIITVFVPTTPNPTSGFLLYVDENEIKRLNISVETAFKMIVSGGIISDGEEIIYKRDKG